MLSASMRRIVAISLSVGAPRAEASKSRNSGVIVSSASLNAGPNCAPHASAIALN
jgi:hypothetical protein